jgi:serine O-acetyltransferase
MFENVRDDFNIHGRSLRNAGFWTMLVYRFGVWSLGRRFGPWRWLTSKMYGVLQLLSSPLTGVVIDRRTRLGRGFHIIHAGMQQIHPDVVIGERCGMMHNVTLGTNMGADAPVIGNDVFIGCGASVLGKVKVGDGARIAANSLVITDVPPGAVAMGVPAKVLPNMDLLRAKAAAKLADNAAPPAGAGAGEARA